MGNELVVCHERIRLLNNPIFEVDNCNPNSLIDSLPEKTLSEYGEALNIGRVFKLTIKRVT